MKQNKDFITLLHYANNVKQALDATTNTSLIEYTSVARVEPIVLLDQSISNLSFMPDVIQSLTSIFSAYYLQAVSLTLNVGSVDVKKVLDKVNPNKTPLANIGELSALEAYNSDDFNQYKLPGYKVDSPVDFYQVTGLENKGSGNTMAINSNNNLAVGKLLEISVDSEGSKATFPVMVRMVPVVSRASDIVNVLTANSKDKSFMGRWNQWRSGQISFVKDLVLCQDLISAHKKGMMNDPTGIYKENASRKNRGILSTIVSGEISVGTASNIIVISTSTQKLIERELRGRFKSSKTRDKFFKDTYGMLLVIVDPEWEGVTIYHRSIESPTLLSASDMKNAGKGGPDIGELLKAYQLGNAPKF